MRVLLAAGGTGGHVYPALSLAGALAARGHEITFVGGAGERIETRAVPLAGYPLRTLPARGLTSKRAAPAAGWALVRSVFAARRLLRDVRPDVVVGFGGYTSVAPAIAAAYRRVPLVLHEQNSRLTLAHTMSLRFARGLALSLPMLAAPASRRRLAVETTGNPLRPALRQLAVRGRLESRPEAARRIGLDDGATTVVVMGGSQGAKVLNESVPDAMPDGVQVLHLAGPGRLKEARDAWARRRMSGVVVLEYLEAMQDAYACADVVVGRSGASTCAELLALGVPSVLVPLPFGGFQDANARVLEQAGAAVAVPQSPAGFADRLREAVERVCSSAAERATLGDKARALGRPDAADALAVFVERAAL